MNEVIYSVYILNLFGYYKATTHEDDISITITYISH